MNSTIKPFDNLNVRKAVVAASDRTALQLTRGGTAAGDLATHFLPPASPASTTPAAPRAPAPTSWPTRAATWRWPRSTCSRPRRQDPSLPIDANGMWTGSEPAAHGRVATPTRARRPAEVAQAQFEKLGFKIKFRTVPQDTLYTKFCNVPKAQIAICPNVGFFKDFNDPQALLDPVFNGKNILPANNSNWSQLNDPAINDAMAKAGAAAPGPERNKAWGEIDDMVTAAGAGDPVPVGQDPHGRGGRRPRRGQRVLRPPGTSTSASLK